MELQKPAPAYWPKFQETETVIRPCEYGCGVRDIMYVANQIYVN